MPTLHSIRACQSVPCKTPTDHLSVIWACAVRPLSGELYLPRCESGLTHGSERPDLADFVPWSSIHWSNESDSHEITTVFENCPFTTEPQISFRILFHLEARDHQIPHSHRCEGIGDLLRHLMTEQNDPLGISENTIGHRPHLLSTGEHPPATRTSEPRPPSAR